MTAQQPKKLPIKLLVGVFVVSTVVSGIVIFLVLRNFVVTEDDTYSTILFDEQGAEGVRTIDPPREVADFTLPSHTGDDFSISELRGQHVLLYFGYTSCPDVCPMTLLDFQQVREILGEDADIAYMMVTVDPERDTTEKLARYFEMRNLEDFMLGMVGDELTLRQISPDYGLYWQKNDDVDPVSGYYTVDHTANVFLLDPQGRLTNFFAFGTQPEIIAETIEAQL